jgi:hypothetical protein
LGSLSAEFNIAINCSENVLPITSAIFFANPFESKFFLKDITVKTQDFENNECDIFLYDAIGNLLD